VEAYRINIVGLSNTVHHFDYDIDDAFFQRFGHDLLEHGSFHADVTVDKHETFLDVKFHIKGVAKLVCDRSLDPFDFPVDSTHSVLFKYGEENAELSDEIVMIHRDSVSLELGQYLYEFIGLALPMKRLHPRYQDEDDDEEEGKIIYSSETTDEDTGEIDPRWEKLKKLK